jgi:hypothetical protein
MKEVLDRVYLIDVLVRVPDPDRLPDLIEEIHDLLCPCSSLPPGTPCRMDVASASMPKWANDPDPDKVYDPCPQCAGEGFVKRDAA